ncbi:MAG: vWA domain-containing protein [Chlamydiota bacterium]
MTLPPWQYYCPIAVYGLFILFPIAGLFWYSHYRCRKALHDFAHPCSWKTIFKLRPRWYHLLHATLLSGAWTAGVIAMMGPQGRATSETQKLAQHKIGDTPSLVDAKKDVIFLIDTSASMSTPDAIKGENRLAYAQDIVDKLTHDLSGRLLSLYAFTSELTPLSPPTYNNLYLRLMNYKLQINEGDSAGTDFQQALVHLQHNYPYYSNHKILIILSDGGDNRLENLKGNPREEAIKAIADTLPNQNWQILTIGIGSRQGAPIPNIQRNGEAIISFLEPDILQHLAQGAKNHYFQAYDYSVDELVTSILQLIEAPSTSRSSYQPSKRQNAQQHSGNNHFFQTPLALAIILISIDLLLIFLPISRDYDQS